jgi:hypothetical protein
MLSKIDWKGVFRELRLLVIQLQPMRFFALYVLLLIVVVACVSDKLGRLL